ncbi:MAG: LptF/LptG family permease [Crocinitomicaceae bacterium]|nr:LptF/LptG family permease [Crocinitomicaceae bacterium]
MKRLHIFIIRSFIGPFLITLFIAMFFLVMQFVWKYIDDLIGKGLDFTIMLELLFYVSITLIPLALPLAVLFSSIMTYGNLAEHNELTAMKASGLSLLKVMRPMFYFVIILSISAFYFTNFLMPVANYKWRAMIYDIQEKKPTFGLTPGVFYNDIDGYSIRVGAKNDNTGSLDDVLIYQYNDISVGKTIKSKTGEMLKSENERYLLLKLNSGAMYEKMKIGSMQNSKYPYQKTYFDEAIIKFDMAQFQMQETNEDLFKRDFEMMNFIQLQETIDSMKIYFRTMNSDFGNVLKREMVLFNDAYKVDTNKVDTTGNVVVKEIQEIDTIIHIDSLIKQDIKPLMTYVQNEIRSRKEMLNGQKMFRNAQKNVMYQFQTTLHKKFTLSVAIIVLFFIGAPLGAIIKKGGLGAPLVFATLFFLLYYILTIMGENMVESQFIEPWKGMWMSTIILTPLGAFLTYKAANDSALFDREAYKKAFRWIGRKLFGNRGNLMKSKD